MKTLTQNVPFSTGKELYTANERGMTRCSMSVTNMELERIRDKAFEACKEQGVLLQEAAEGEVFDIMIRCINPNSHEFDEARAADDAPGSPGSAVAGNTVYLCTTYLFDEYCRNPFLMREMARIDPLGYLNDFHKYMVVVLTKELLRAAAE